MPTRPDEPELPGGQRHSGDDYEDTASARPNPARRRGEEPGQRVRRIITWAQVIRAIAQAVDAVLRIFS